MRTSLRRCLSRAELTSDDIGSRIFIAQIALDGILYFLNKILDGALVKNKKCELECDMSLCIFFTTSEVFFEMRRPSQFRSPLVYSGLESERLRAGQQHSAHQRTHRIKRLIRRTCPQRALNVICERDVHPQRADAPKRRQECPPQRRVDLAEPFLRQGAALMGSEYECLG